MGQLQDKVAIVTGAAQGIGRAVASKYVEEGARVVIADLLYDEAAEFSEQLNSQHGQSNRPVALPLKITKAGGRQASQPRGQNAPLSMTSSSGTAAKSSYETTLSSVITRSSSAAGPLASTGAGTTWRSSRWTRPASCSIRLGIRTSSLVGHILKRSDPPGS